MILKIRCQSREISEKAILVAQKNADFHGVSDRLEIIQGDFFSFFPSPLGGEGPRSGGEGCFDFIISNPPYVSESEMTVLPPTILKYEPHAALRAGSQGLDFYPAIAQFSKNHLKENGFVAVEIGDTQAEAIKNIFSKTGFSNIQIKRDYAGKDRVLWANYF